MKILQLFKKRPWFRLTTADGEEIEGRVQQDNSLDLVVKNPWYNHRLKLQPAECERILVWLQKAYGKQ